MNESVKFKTSFRWYYKLLTTCIKQLYNWSYFSVSIKNSICFSLTVTDVCTLTRDLLITPFILVNSRTLKSSAESSCYDRLLELCLILKASKTGSTSGVPGAKTVERSTSHMTRTEHWPISNSSLWPAASVFLLMCRLLLPPLGVGLVPT